MWAPLEATDTLGDSTWLVAHTVTRRILGVSRNTFDVIRFDTERDAQIMCDALNQVSYR